MRYSDESRFHLDVLPAIPDDPAWYRNEGVRSEWAETAIKITDKSAWTEILPSWPRSNPRGYAAWFKDRMKVRLEEGRRIVAMQKRADVQSVPDYEVRTPLQRLVQVLKSPCAVALGVDVNRLLAPVALSVAMAGTEAKKISMQPILTDVDASTSVDSEP